MRGERKDRRQNLGGSESRRPKVWAIEGRAIDLEKRRLAEEQRQRTACVYAGMLAGVVAAQGKLKREKSWTAVRRDLQDLADEYSRQYQRLVQAEE